MAEGICPRSLGLARGGSLDACSPARLDAYLLHMLIALVAIIALVTALA